MAKLVEMDRAVRGSSYPYDEWFNMADGLDGQQFLQLSQGEDYTIKTNSIAQTIRTAAEKFGYGIRVAVDKNDECIGIQTWQLSGTQPKPSAPRKGSRSDAKSRGGKTGRSGRTPTHK